ncbi:MAG: methyltransferase domain-containing protein [Candidatus Sphingomonas colombiensis]|nr:methyltransferase domain-containing protein [Sphingomonas sp.]WEK44383.1 MAG: methyltransferase domain-containing protein [Sphingomonas sp.]
MKPDIYYTNARLDVVALIPDRNFSRILEVGGGDFPTLHKLGEDRQAEIWGVDVRRPEPTFDNFVEGSITDPAVVARLPQDGFDLIVANDVIEHVEQTEEFFRVLLMMLRPGGLLALSVPNIRQIRTAYHIFVRGTFPRDEAGLFDRTHLRWFCKKDVVALATRAGFTLKDWRGSGRLVPSMLARIAPAEFLALQNLFIFAK